MSVRLYNTLTQKIEDFVPHEPGKVKLYVCGITVYDLAHAGHGRTYTTFDVLVRFLRARGYEVSHCQNVTDVDDKIVNRAKERGEDPLALSKRMGELADEHLAAIGCLKPTAMPRVSSTIDGIVEITQKLIDKGHAYVVDTPQGKDVYYAVRDFPGYGKLSRRNLDDLRAGASERLAEGASDVKRDPLDFALWKAAGPEGFGFDSPWGRGRPGWHIECSAMAAKILGEQIDIHGGGMDLVFPHHENEVAQSRCAHGTDVMANYWMHNGFLQVEGEKMSKSLGNFVTIRELLETDGFGGRRWPGEVLRLAMLMSHYRQPIDFSVRTLEIAEKTLDNWYRVVGDADPSDASDFAINVDAALSDDLNTPSAIAQLHTAYDVARDGESNAAGRFKLAANRLGLLVTDESAWKVARAAGVTIDSAAVDRLINARLAARKAKNWAESDRIRDELAAMGIQLKDGKDPATGEAITTWEVKR